MLAVVVLLNEQWVHGGQWIYAGGSYSSSPRTTTYTDAAQKAEIIAWRSSADFAERGRIKIKDIYGELRVFTASSQTATYVSFARPADADCAGLANPALRLYASEGYDTVYMYVQMQSMWRGDTWPVSAGFFANVFNADYTLKDGADIWLEIDAEAD